MPYKLRSPVNCQQYLSNDYRVWFQTKVFVWRRRMLGPQLIEDLLGPITQAGHWVSLWHGIPCHTWLTFAINHALIYKLIYYKIPICHHIHSFLQRDLPTFIRALMQGKGNNATFVIHCAIWKSFGLFDCMIDDKSDLRASLFAFTFWLRFCCLELSGFKVMVKLF